MSLGFRGHGGSWYGINMEGFVRIWYSVLRRGMYLDMGCEKDRRSYSGAGLCRAFNIGSAPESCRFRCFDIRREKSIL